MAIRFKFPKTIFVVFMPAGLAGEVFHSLKEAEEAVKVWTRDFPARGPFFVGEYNLYEPG